MEMELIFISEISQLAPELFCLVAGARGGAGLREPGTEGAVWDVQTRESSMIPQCIQPSLSSHRHPHLGAEFAEVPEFGLQLIPFFAGITSALKMLFQHFTLVTVQTLPRFPAEIHSQGRLTPARGNSQTPLPC